MVSGQCILNLWSWVCSMNAKGESVAIKICAGFKTNDHGNQQQSGRSREIFRARIRYGAFSRLAVDQMVGDKNGVNGLFARNDHFVNNSPFSTPQTPQRTRWALDRRGARA